MDLEFLCVLNFSDFFYNVLKFLKDDITRRELSRNELKERLFKLRSRRSGSFELVIEFREKKIIDKCHEVNNF